MSTSRRKSKRNRSKNKAIEANSAQIETSAEVPRNQLQRLTQRGNKAAVRDMNSVLGYPDHITIEDYIAAYSRKGLATRVVNAFPDAIWSKPPRIQDDNDITVETEFETRVAQFARRTKLFHYLNRLDKLAGLGHYAVMLIGVRDGKPLSEPLTSLNSLDDVVYLMPFGESCVTVQTFETQVANERYGRPVTYRIRAGGYHGDNSNSMPSSMLTVHHSRVIHVAEGTLENDVFGIPRLEPVFDRLTDLEKVVGGSAEIYWLNGRGGLNLNAVAGSVIDKPGELEVHVDNYVNQLTRVLKTKGMDVKTLELAVAPPDKHVSVVLDLIAGATGIPKRILIGSERGELASSQDEGNWLNRVGERRETHCETVILRPVIDKLISLNLLSPNNDYTIAWPPLVEQSAKQKADNATLVSQAIANYVNSIGSELIIPSRQFVEEVLCMQYREDEVNANADLEAEQMAKDAAELAKQQTKLNA